MVSRTRKWRWPGMSRPSAFHPGPVGWAKTAKALPFLRRARPAVPTRSAPAAWARRDRHPDATETPWPPLPTLRALAFLFAVVPFTANAQSITEKAQACVACHGDNGVPADKSWPVIWGQHQGY